MKMLKVFRAAVSLIVFTALALIFADHYRLVPLWLINGITGLQLIPSLLSFTVFVSMARAGLIIVLILTFFFGRVYCSFICPLGFCQDVFIRIGKIIKKEKNYSYRSPGNILFYSILLITVISIISSGTVLILWIDPFSIFGRFMTYAGSRALLSVNNLFASALIDRNIFIINSLSMTSSTAGTVFAVSVFTLVMAMSLFKGRLYCNMICPAGALLSLVSRLSFFKITFNRPQCIRCGRCEKICKSSCINYKEMDVDFSRCVGCYNCISQCPNGSIGYGMRYSFKGKDKAVKADMQESAGLGGITRFSFISGLLMLPAALLARDKDGKLYYQDSSKQVKINRKSFSSPPGSFSIEKFNRKCTACSLCVSICPTGVLQPAVLHYGLSGIMQPFMDFSSGYCNYECVLCGEVCPAGAIKKISLKEKKLVQTGKSVFIMKNCITYTNGTDCGACSEHCPTKAIRMVPFKNKLVIPELNTDICTGCGACEHVCPVRPDRAIYVEGNPVHVEARSPGIKGKIKIQKSDFPF